MSQHDFDVANGSGLVVRADINAALVALATNNGGASAPATTFANEWWFDTVNNLLKMRSEDNTSWITVASLVGTTWTPYLAGSAIGNGSESVAGLLELATAAETSAFADVARAVHASGLSSALVTILDKRDPIINGSFASNLFGTTSSTTDGAYAGPDLWYALQQSNPFQVEQQTDQENGTPFSVRLTQTHASSQRIGYAHVIKASRCKHLRGKAFRLRLRGRGNTGALVRFAVLEWTGTADAVTKDVVNDWTSGTFTPGNFFNTTSLLVAGTGEITLPGSFADSSLNITALGTTFNNLIIFVWTDAVMVTGGQVDLARVRAREGLLGVDYAPVSPEINDLEVSHYIRYQSGNTKAIASGYSSSTTAGVVFLPLWPPMRITPTLTISAASHFTAQPKAQALTALAMNSNSHPWMAALDITAASGLVADGALAIMSNSASMTFLLDARL